MATIKRVQGNRLELAIPLQTETMTPSGKVVADYNVPEGAEVRVLLVSAWKNLEFVPTSVSGNLVTVVDNGTLPTGKYAVEVRIKEADGTPLRSKYCNIIEVCDCNDGVTTQYDDFIEGSVQLDAQVFYFAKGDKGDDGITPHIDETTGNWFVGDTDTGVHAQGESGATDYNDLENKPDLSGFITISVNNLVNYYLKSETYTKQEVQALIAAIQQFHYEIYASISAVTSPAGNVLYLIGPTGTGADKYEEYVYDATKQEPWVKIGDTSIDLSGYYTSQQTDAAITSALNTALADYTSTAALTLLLAGKQDVINDLSDIRSGAAAGATAYQKPQGGIPSTDLALGMDNVPTSGSDNFVKSGGVYSALQGKQDTLVSGTNIKTINNQSILGEGNITIQGGGSSVQSDWNQTDTEADDYIKNKPTIPAEQVQSDWNQTNNSSKDFIKNKPTIPTVPTNVSDFTNDAGYITKTVNDLVNYYLKSETYTKTEVQTLINAVKQFTYEVVQTLPTATADTMHKIFLVPSADPQTQNVKDEYITIDNGSGATTRYTWEKIGSTDVDLSGYSTTEEMNAAIQTALANCYTKAEADALLGGKQDTLVSGTNIKTINNQSILGEGNITIQGGGSSVQSDWNQTDTEADDYIKNKPTIPAEQVQSDWNQTNNSSKDFIKNKPTIPTVPTNVSAFTNDAGYLTQHQDISGKADKSEMSVADGTGADSDKTTITLKTDTSATVLKSHQSLSGKQDVIDSSHKLSADLVDDTNTTNKFTNAMEKQAWNAKQDALTFNTAPSSSNKVATMADVSVVTGKADKVTGATSGNFAALDSNGNLTDSGHKHSDYLTSHQDISGKEDVTTIVAPVNATDATLPITTLVTEVGKYYRIAVPVETLAVTLPAMENITTTKTVVLYLTGGTTPAVTISSTAPTGGSAPDVYYQDGYAIEAGKTYEVNCLWNGSAWIVASVEIVVTNNGGE